LDISSSWNEQLKCLKLTTFRRFCHHHFQTENCWLIKHRVADYAKWRAVFDDKASLRQENGEKKTYVFCNADDPNNLVLLFEWDNLEKARRYSQDPRPRAAMQDAGVMGQPEVLFLNEA
jgi:hypothetical protein